MLPAEQVLPVVVVVLVPLAVGRGRLPTERGGLAGRGLQLGRGLAVLEQVRGLLEAEVLLDDGAPVDGVLEEGAAAHAREGAQGEVGAAVLRKGGGDAIWELM